MPKMNQKSNPRSDISENGTALRETVAIRAADRVVDSRDLLGPNEEILIRHEGRLYRLRRTRLGKLILTA
jgi:hemin uptake protein HemP